jgi:hypothetical protein
MKNKEKKREMKGGDGRRKMEGWIEREKKEKK